MNTYIWPINKVGPTCSHLEYYLPSAAKAVASYASGNNESPSLDAGPLLDKIQDGRY
jgi:hypothetical protein